MLKKLILSLLILLVSLKAQDYESGKKIFEKKCASCHGKYISIKKLKENFFEKKNRMLNLTIPTENMLAYAIMRSSKKIGDPEDPEMQQIEIEEYLINYLAEPDLSNSICEETIVKYYKKKKPMHISENEASALSLYFMNYREERLKKFPNKTRILSSNYDENELLSDAVENDKLIMVYATAQDCYFCKKMKKDVLDKKDVQEKLKKDYIFVEVDVDKVSLPFNLKKQFKGMTPTFFIINSGGKLLNIYPGAWIKKDFFEIMRENLK